MLSCNRKPMGTPCSSKGLHVWPSSSVVFLIIKPAKKFEEYLLTGEEDAATHQLLLSIPPLSCGLCVSRSVIYSEWYLRLALWLRYVLIILFIY